MDEKGGNVRCLTGIFSDEGRLLAAVRGLNSRNVPIHDVYTPYAVHGLDEAMGLKRSRLPWACFGAGALAFLVAFAFQGYVFMGKWPHNVGGKPSFAWPAFVPVAFEFTVLCGGLAITAAFLLSGRYFPWSRRRPPDARVTDGRFALAVPRVDASLDDEKLRLWFAEYGAEDIREGEVAL